MNRDKAAEFVDALYEAWYLSLLRYTRRLVRQPASAEELVQETFLDLYRCLRAGKSVEFPKAWTMCVARRKALELTHQPFGIERVHEPLESPELSGDWVTGAELNIDCDRVLAHMDLLSAREHEVLLLRLESMKYREIAEALGISINSVNTLLARALTKLQAAMTPAADRRAL
ncbi:MAG: RNA polymerase sigma factor [Acidobacteria bacterium]|nr:RNA polymerase sigma factor [Acidobacteriota bacterium]